MIMASPTAVSPSNIANGSSGAISPTVTLKLDPQKERKLEERLNRAPGSRSQIGFDNAHDTTTSSLPSMQGYWEENSRGKESSKSRIAITREEANSRPEGSNQMAATNGEEPRRKNESGRSILDVLGKKPFSPNLKRSKSEDSVASHNEMTSDTRGKNGVPPSASPRVEETSETLKLAPDAETMRIGESEDMDDDDPLVEASPQRNQQGSAGPDKVKKGRFTPEEDECLLAKYAEFGPNWKLVSQHGGELLAGRTPNALSRRYVTLAKKSGPRPSTSSSSSVPPATQEEEEDEVQIIESGNQSSTAAAAGQPQISQFFKPINGASTTSSSTSSAAAAPHAAKRSRPSSPGVTAAQSAVTQQLSVENQRLTLELEKARREKHEAENMLESKSKEFEKSLEEMKLRTSRATELIISMLRAADKTEAARSRKHWEDGQAKRDLAIREAQLLQQKTELERQQKQLKNSKRRLNATAQNQLEVELEERALEEVRAARLAKLKLEEAQIFEDKNRFQVEKALHMRELKRIRDEDSSKWLERPVLVNRYLLRSMLGKGGFSEVWKAFDLLEMRDVAIKIHELDPAWNEERRRNYSKHAKREYQIHLALRHPRIVQLYDVIEINQSSSFATVLEYCPGTDLDVYLKKHKCLPEKEAKSILMQILSGLLCLASGGGVKDSSSIIHYDIKPANILFDAEGGVKLTDFGLSKIVTDERDDTVPGVELTSQGAGTYWYLPPECFDFDRKNPPKISNKVDVWSTGVVFYQMLFGQRPFGEGLSQEAMLKAETVRRATKVEFPPKPVVSDAAKDFIRRCLTHSQQLRPDVETLCQDPYLRNVKKRPAPPANGSSTTTTTTSSSGSMLPFGE